MQQRQKKQDTPKPLSQLVEEFDPTFCTRDAKKAILKLLADDKTTDQERCLAFRKATYRLHIAEEKGEPTVHAFLATKKISAQDMQAGLAELFKLSFILTDMFTKGYLTDKLKRSLELYDFLKQFKPVNEYHTVALESEDIGPILKAFLQTERFLRERAVDNQETHKSLQFFGFVAHHSGVKKDDELSPANELNQLIRQFINKPSRYPYKGLTYGYEQLAKDLMNLQKKYPALMQGRLDEICTVLIGNVALEPTLGYHK